MNKDELENEVLKRLMEIIYFIEENIRDDNMSQTVEHFSQAVLQVAKTCDIQNKIKEEWN